MLVGVLDPGGSMSVLVKFRQQGRRTRQAEVDVWAALEVAGSVPSGWSGVGKDAHNRPHCPGAIAKAMRGGIVPERAGIVRTP
jgi:hypothetical protein